LVRGLGIKISLQAGVAVLSGTVQESSTVEKAENWVRQQTGVTQVSNRLVAASVFEWD
jgi:osmotically-inducible protein OsmY